mmetsp:Transcript_77475/g.206930  ORF Transcript_77475/g.206930 Transcript_77475/m.206930 type:complete len:258 (+) Transcript_77475:1634-2407(+)
MCEDILRAGGRVSARDCSGRTAIDLAEPGSEVEAHLLSYGSLRRSDAPPAIERSRTDCSSCVTCIARLGFDPSGDVLLAGMQGRWFGPFGASISVAGRQVIVRGELGGALDPVGSRGLKWGLWNLAEVDARIARWTRSPSLGVEDSLWQRAESLDLQSALHTLVSARIPRTRAELGGLGQTPDPQLAVLQGVWKDPQNAVMCVDGKRVTGSVVGAIELAPQTGCWTLGMWRLIAVSATEATWEGGVHGRRQVRWEKM